MAYFRCTTGGSGKGNTLVVTCADDLAGATITCTNGTKTYRKTCPSTAPYEVTFYGLEAGTWTVSTTVSGSTYTTTVVITDYEAELGGFSWRTWVDTASQLDSSDYNSLDEVLEDEEAVRELCLEHACVDYLADIATTNEDVETIINNDLFAKWVNNSDYALDNMAANSAIKAVMDEADKYGYGEWALVGQVPKMTSNTAPYGEASASSSYGSSREAWNAFDSESNPITKGWTSAYQESTPWLQYKFIEAECIKKVHVTLGKISLAHDIQFKIQVSNNGSDFVDVSDVITITQSSGNVVDALDVTIDTNGDSYLYYRMQFLTTIMPTSTSANFCIFKLQFYAWAPKGNVPIMTANNAPYGTVSASSEYSSTYAAYKAFDGNESTAWASTSGTSAHIVYKFANPIYPKAWKISAQDGYAYNVKLSGSNDGTNYTDLSEIISDSATDKKVTKNFGYYLYLKVSYSSTSATTFNTRTLQFYGRELSVSVPTMTSDTAPYGEAFASYEWNNDHAAYKSFIPYTSYSVNWTPASNATNNFLGYDFKKPVNVKKFYVDFIGANSTFGTKNFTYKIQASNDGETYVDLANGAVNGVTFNAHKYAIDSISSNESYRYYRLFVPEVMFLSGSYQLAVYPQFYGLDYSEKEFEAGTTKKWLYDHGVNIDNSVSLTQPNQGDTFEADYVALKSQWGRVTTEDSIDLTPYSVLRAKIGARASNTAHLYVYHNGSEIATKQITTNDMPYNSGLDISNVNQVGAVFVNVSLTTGEADISEFWLE